MDSIQTARLILRPFTLDDYDDLYELLSQRRDDIFEGYPGITRENGREHLAYRVGSDDFYAMEVRLTGKVIGNVYFGKRDFKSRELGYIVNKHFQRQGYAAEAIQAVLAAGFSAGVHRVYAECDPRNKCSWGLLEHLGFTREALLRQNIFFRRDDAGNPIWQDTYVYGLLSSDQRCVRKQPPTGSHSGASF